MAVSGTHVSPRKKQVIQIHSSRLFKHILTGYHLQYELISLSKIHHATNNSRIFHHAWSVSTIKSKETSSLRPVQQEKKTQDKYHQKRQLNTCISSIWGTYISIDCRDRVLPLISVLLQLGNPSPYRQETRNKIQISPTNGVAIQNASQYTLLSLTANCSTHQPPPSTSDLCLTEITPEETTTPGIRGSALVHKCAEAMAQQWALSCHLSCCTQMHHEGCNDQEQSR